MENLRLYALDGKHFLSFDIFGSLQKRKGRFMFEAFHEL